MNQDYEVSDFTASVIVFGIILLVSYMACAFIGASFDPFVWPVFVRAVLLGLLVLNLWFAFGDLPE